MAKRTFILNITKHTDWLLADETIEDIHEGEYLAIFGVLNHKDGKIVSGFDQDASREDIEEAKKIKAFSEEVKINVKVDAGAPKYETLTEETFEGILLDALIYVHKTNKEK